MLTFVAICVLLPSALSFLGQAPLRQLCPTHGPTLFSTTSEAATTTSSASSLLGRDRYYATNRFTTRKGKAAKFERRWATRKSRLATLGGFRYFNLMRRVRLDDEEAIDNFDYVSLTVWKGKSDFNAWRQGDAFKVRRSRAHTERSDERRVFVEMSTYKMSTSEMSTP